MPKMRTSTPKSALNAAYVRQPDKSLAAFFAAVGNRDNAPVNIHVLGDSLAEGQGATAFGRGWVTRLPKVLAARLPVSGLTTPGFQHFGTWGNAAPYYRPFTWTGVVGTDYDVNITFGWPRMSTWIKTATATATFTFTGTSFEIFALKTTGGGVLTVTVDGGAATNVDLNAASIDEQFVWRSSALTAGSHTVVIGRTAAAGGVFITGVATYNGDETKGFRVFNGGHSGWTTQSFLDNGGQANKWPGGYKPDLLILELGINDENSGTTPAQFQTKIQTLITQLMTGLTKTPSVLLLAAYERQVMTTATWPQYVQAMQAVVDANTNMALLDLSRRMPKVGSNASFASAYSDGTHPSDAGHALMADYVAGFLAPR